MIIYFRACEKQATISNVLRAGNIDKSLLLKKCWKSLQSSVAKEDLIILIYDTVSLDTLSWMKSSSATNNLEMIEVEDHDWSYHGHTVTLVETLKHYSEIYPNEIHYIVEDDYIHEPNAISVIKSTLGNWEGFAVTYDYPDRYADIKPTKIVLGADRHWRFIDSCTMTVLALGKTWTSVIELLEKAAPTSNDKVFEEIFTKIPCVSPLPGLSSHMTDRHTSPFMNIEKIYNDIIIE